VVVTREARFGLNGPQVIEQEAGIDEYDSRNRPFIWSFSGGEQRFKTGLADRYVEDNVHGIGETVRSLFTQGLPATHRDERVDEFLALFNRIDTTRQADSASVRADFGKEL
jgi:malonate decarboxylase beta subunit